jgi:DNA-binding IclR family transcriptional regulator
MSTTGDFGRIADALLTACGPVDGQHQYVGTVAPNLGVPLPEIQRVLDKMEQLGLVECTTQNPLQCRLTTWGARQMTRRGLPLPEIETT